ncbi:MAG: DUF4097 family beta strand repeat-containing protein [Flavobacteriaceae bacterium]|nr:DUF4097 family beta strand repeat-containing protein [Flavobacteriaceae bacterium]
MKRLKILKLRLFTLAVCISGSILAQQKVTKVSQTIKVDKDVTIDLNTSYCNIVFDTWNKDSVEIEAYIEGEELSKEELQEALKDWQVTVNGTNSLVTISTKSNSPYAWEYTVADGEYDAVNAVLQELKFELADLPEMPDMPRMPEMPNIPELPELPEGISKMNFDYDAYKKNGDAYMEQWSKNFDKNFGEDYAKKMEEWGEKFGKEWEEKYGKEMEAWGEKFGKEWEAKYGKQMEEWSERFAKQMEEKSKRIEAQSARIEERVAERKKMVAERGKQADERAKLADERRAMIDKMMNNNSSKVKKTIKIKMPKDAKLKVNVRYGELKFASNIDNLRADLSHTKFMANSINGSKTSINASYSPIFVTNWKLGTLKLNYVNNAEIDNVNSLTLTSNASNITIKNLINSAMINGSIGDLKVFKIDDTFTNLNVTLENSDAFIALPKVEYNLQYKGNKSRLAHPKKINKESVSSFSTGNLSNPKTIVVNAKYSNVTMQ